MRRAAFALAIAAALFAAAPVRADEAEAVLYKDPGCGCCAEYAKYLRGHGFRVTVKETAALEALRRMAGVSDKLASCHTMTVEGYVVEGHVPVSAVNKLIAERPQIRGIALPGMPQGSPGMSGTKESPFVVHEIGGRPKVFAVE